MLGSFVWTRRIGIWVVVAMLAACAGGKSFTPATESGRDLEEGLSRTAVVAVGSPRLDRNKPSTISWIDTLDIAGQHPVLEADALRSIVTDQVNRQMEAKGYPVVAVEGDFQLSGVLILAGPRDEDRILRESGGVDPGLTGYDELPGKGSLVLELRQGRVTRWKGSVQIYIAPHFDQQVALRRIDYAIAQLLGTWP